MCKETVSVCIDCDVWESAVENLAHVNATPDEYINRCFKKLIAYEKEHPVLHHRGVPSDELLSEIADQVMDELERECGHD